jgi:hypothetical protein
VVVGTTAGLGTADVETTTRGARYSFQVIRTGAGLTVAEIPRMKILVVDRNPLMRFGLLAFLRAEDDSLTICVAENIHLRAYLWTEVIRWERRKHRRTAWQQLRQRYSRWPAWMTWNCSTRPEYTPRGMSTGEHGFPHPGRTRHEEQRHTNGVCGEPGAQ